MKVKEAGKGVKVKEAGNYKMPNWSIDVLCSGEGWKQKNKPCYSTLTVEDGGILKRKYRSWDEVQVTYGCICPTCKCFTQINEKLIPRNVKEYAPMVAAKGSGFYNELNDEEKKLSEDL